MHLFLNISEQFLALFIHFRHVIGLQTVSFLQSLHIHQVSIMFPLSLGSDQFTLFLGSCQFTFVQNVLLIANVLLAIMSDENRWKFSIFLHQRQHYVIHPSISASRTINALSVLCQRAQMKPFEKYRFQWGFLGRSLSRLQNTHKQKPQQMFLQNQQPQNQLTLMIKLQSKYITSLYL